MGVMILAERRMFTKKITDSDAFIELSSAAQALYFHLNQGADDDGFTNQVQNAMFKAHASIDDLKILMAKNFVIRFESGVIVIKHWRMHNTLRKDRYTPTNYQDELSQLGIKDNGSYTWLADGCQVVANGLPQVSIGKDSKGKVSLGEGSVVEATAATTKAEEGNQLKLIGGTLGRNVVYLTDNQMADLIDKLGLDAFNRYVGRLADYIIEKNAHIKNHYDTILKWHKEDTIHNTPRHQSGSQNEYKSYDIDDFFEAAMKSSMRELDKY
jgi:hypothetical protein